MSKKNEKSEMVAVQDIDKLLVDSVELIHYARSLAARQVIHPAFDLLHPWKVDC